MYCPSVDARGWHTASSSFPRPEGHDSITQAWMNLLEPRFRPDGP